ncbi:MAG: hypothetical protein R3320_07490 [Nitriliruptorales bacterium]|nr:hypothetical protein [Nitriliruptorales bacterium]
MSPLPYHGSMRPEFDELASRTDLDRECAASDFALGTWRRFTDRDPERDVIVAVIGAGFMGRGLVHQLGRCPGIRPAVVANRRSGPAVAAFEGAGWEAADVLVCDDPDEIASAVDGRRPVVTHDARLAASLPPVDVVVEATGAMTHGARTIMTALEHGKHVVSLNAEVDATIGTLLHGRASEQGAVYSIADGDQPGVLLRQLSFVSSLGFEIVAAVNCKRNLDVHQNPDDSRPYAERDGTSVHMTTAFGDGTKMQIENVVVANLTGLVPDRRGMHGVRTTLERGANDIAAVLSRVGVVDYTLGGDFGGGVCVVGRSEEPEHVRDYMRYAKMGEGPNYLFFRPYHLMHMEVPATIADIMVHGMGLGRARGAPVAEAVAIAKKDLRPGDALDGIGGFCCYGHIDNAASAHELLPIGLAEHARMIAPVDRDQPIPRGAVELDEEAEIVRLRAVQDEMVGSAAPV